MKKCVTIFLICILVLTALSITQVMASETKRFKFGFSEITSDNIVESPYLVLSSVFKGTVERLTNGQIIIDNFPNFQLGGLESMLKQTSVGELEFTAGQDIGNLAIYDPIFQLINIPYLFPSTEVARKVLEGPFGDLMNERLIKAANIRILAWLPSSFRNFSNNVRPIQTPKDMMGLKMRVMNIPIHMKVVEALGALPTPVAWTELYTALQLGVADGQENAPYTMLMQDLQTVQKYYTLDGHFLNAVIWVMSEEVFQSLTPYERYVIKRAAREAQFSFLGLVAATETQDLEKLAEDMEIYTPKPEEIEQFREAAQPVVIEILKKEINPELIDQLLQYVREAEEELGYINK